MSSFEPFDPDEEELALGSHRPRRDLLRRLSWRWRAGVLVVLVAAVVIPLVATSSHGGKPAAERRTSAAKTHAPTRTSTSVPAPPEPMPVITRIHRDFLGIHAPWELFGWAGSEMVRIQFARGRVTTTQLPAVQSSGPVYFLAGSHSALIHPLDNVAGFVVPDGQPAQPEPKHLACGGPALPGPAADEVWVPPCSGNRNRLFLTRLDGRRVGPSLLVPGGSADEALPDGQGYVLLPSYRRSQPTLDVQPDTITQLAQGPVLAVGPTRLLLRRCHDHVCLAVVVNRQTGVVRAFRAPPATGPGLISPNGSTAALTTPKTKLLTLLDLRTGASSMVSTPVYDSGLQTMVFSPDSRWLFGVDFSADLWAVNMQTGRVFRNLTFGLHIPLLTELAIRA